MARRKLPSEIFAKYVNTDGPINPKTGTKCHLWTGAVQDGTGSAQDGFGLFQLPYRQFTLAHRFAWERVHGQLHVGHYVHHDDPDVGCGRLLCVNVEHLREAFFKGPTERGSDV